MSNRHFHNPSTPSTATTTTNLNIHAELLASLTRINTYNPPVQTCSTGWTFHGIYSGPTSIAYLFYRLSQLYPALTFKGQCLTDWAVSYLELGTTRLARRRKNDVDASHCGIANETLCQLALRAVLEGDPSLARELCSFSNIVNHPSTLSNEKRSNEWLYGRAGYLYLLRLVKRELSTDRNTHGNTQAVIDKTITETCDAILAVPTPWKWHGTNYVGAAHGTAGILTQIILSKPEYADKIERVLQELLDCQFGSGNFPSSLRETVVLATGNLKEVPGKDELVQFCHGSPGLVLCLVSIRPFVSTTMRQRIDFAVAKARADVWRRGILRKTPCLCHGVPGNVLSFLDFEAGDTEQAIKDENMQRFRTFLQYMTTHALETKEDADGRSWLADAGRTDEFAGLYVGEAGRAWVWAVAEIVLGQKELPPRVSIGGGCIGFNDL